MSRFDFSMGQTNSLNRIANEIKGVERDNQNQVMLKKKWLEIRAMGKEQLLIERAEKEIIEKIKKLEAKNNKVVKVEEIKKIEVKVLNNKWQIEDELVLKERKIYVPKDENLKLEIIWLHYDMPIVEHRRQ